MLVSFVPRLSTLCCTVKRVKKLGVQQVQHFPFPSPPPTDALRAAIRNLRRLGSLSSSNFHELSHEAAVRALNSLQGKDSEAARKQAADLDEGRLTAVGLAAASYPVSVRFGKMLALGNELGCVALVATLVAALSVRAPFLRVVDTEEANNAEKPVGTAINDSAEEEDADGPTKAAETVVRFLNIHQAHGKWACGDSDALSVLNTLGAYLFHRKVKTYTASELCVAIAFAR